MTHAVGHFFKKCEGNLNATSTHIFRIGETKRQILPVTRVAWPKLNQASEPVDNPGCAAESASMSFFWGAGGSFVFSFSSNFGQDMVSLDEQNQKNLFEVFVNMIGYIWLHHCNGNSEVPRSRHIQTLRDYKEVSERTCYNKPLPILIAQKNWGPAIRLRKSMLRPFWRLPTSLNWLVLFFFLPLFNAKCLQMESKDVLAIKVLQKVVAKCQSAGNAA